MLSEKEIGVFKEWQRLTNSAISTIVKKKLSAYDIKRIGNGFNASIRVDYVNPDGYKANFEMYINSKEKYKGLVFGRYYSLNELLNKGDY